MERGCEDGAPGEGGGASQGEGSGRDVESRKDHGRSLWPTAKRFCSLRAKDAPPAVRSEGAVEREGGRSDRTAARLHRPILHEIIQPIRRWPRPEALDVGVPTHRVAPPACPGDSPHGRRRCRPRPALRLACPAERPDRPGGDSSPPSTPGRATRPGRWPTTSSPAVTSSPAPCRRRGHGRPARQGARRRRRQEPGRPRRRAARLAKTSPSSATPTSRRTLAQVGSGPDRAGR